MSTGDDQQSWPPPPSQGHQAQIDEVSQKSDTWRLCLACAGRKLTIKANYKFYTFQCTLNWVDWIRPLGCGVAGSVFGVVVLLTAILLLLFYGHLADWIIDSKIALFLAAVGGLVGGFVCGVGGWFAGRSLVRWKNDRRSYHQPHQ